jgi:hypothetical protein
MFVQMDELACFAPGMLALGSSGYGPGDAKKFMSLAQEVFSSNLFEGNALFNCLIQNSLQSLIAFVEFHSALYTVI